MVPPTLSKVHPIFHVSQLRRYVKDPSHYLEFSKLQIEKDLSYEEKPMKIIDRREKRLRNRTMSLVLFQWGRHSVKEATWELEDTIREQYPELFFSTAVQKTER